MHRHKAHVENIALVARQLTKLGTEVIFTGGAIVGLLLTESGATDVRPTDDVDAIVAITQYADYVSLQEQLRKLGFKHDMDGPNCRFILDGLKVDIMPSEGTILGFTNRWYDIALRTAQEHLLADGTLIRVISAPAFIATKLEAFFDRGKGDLLLSHDMEDIVVVVDGRPELLDEIQAGDIDLLTYISDRFAEFVRDRQFIDSIGMHLLPDEGSQSRATIISDRINAISKLKGTRH
jgi:predicted nucleotidyltransferase